MLVALHHFAITPPYRRVQNDYYIPFSGTIIGIVHIISYQRVVDDLLRRIMQKGKRFLVL